MNKFIAAALFLFVTALSSCVSDHPLVNETSFNMAERDPDARLLKEIRELTLRDSVFCPWRSAL